MKIKFTTSLDDELVKKIKIEAINKGVSVATIIEKLITEYLSKKTN